MWLIKNSLSRCTLNWKVWWLWRDQFCLSYCCKIHEFLIFLMTHPVIKQKLIEQFWKTLQFELCLCCPTWGHIMRDNAVCRMLWNIFQYRISLDLAVCRSKQLSALHYNMLHIKYTCGFVFLALREMRVMGNCCTITAQTSASRRVLLDDAFDAMSLYIQFSGWCAQCD